MLNVEQNIAIALSLSDLTPSEIQRKVYTLAQELHIEHKLKSSISELSGGEKQRCIIARALINEPKILLCDEPTANLDRENALKFITLLSKLKKKNRTIIIATHDLIFEELDIVDNRFQIKDGKIE
jgi:putative ABC transport system ATP-binding protein